MKKRIFVSALAALVVMPLSVSAMTASAAISIGTPATTVTKSWGTYKKYSFSYTGSYSTYGSTQNVFYGEYDVKDLDDYEFVVANVHSSSGGILLRTVAQIASSYQTETGRKVVMAINGDYFTSAGNSVSSLVQEGNVHQTWYTAGETPKHDCGWDNEGNFVVGQLKETKDVVRMTAKNGLSYEIPIDKVNSKPSDGEIALYTQAHAVSIPGAEKYVFDTGDASTVMAKRPLTGASRRMFSNASATLSLDAGQFALVVAGESQVSEFMAVNATYNSPCTVAKAPAGEFDGMQYVVGGWEILVEDGVKANTSSFHTGNGGAADAPRSFVGSRADGSMFLCVANGRNQGGAGFSVKELADLAISLGANNALELDGGGSSSFLYDTGSGLTRQNTYSDGSARSVSNAILLVEKDPDAVEYQDVQTWSPNAGADSSSSETQNSGNAGGEGESSSSGGCGSVTIGSISVLLAGSFLCAQAINKRKKHGGNEHESS